MASSPSAQTGYDTITDNNDNTIICPGSAQNNVSQPNSSSSEGDAMFNYIAYNIVSPTLYMLITLAGVMGNSLVIFVIVSREEMRKLTNLMLLNLAVADILFLLVTPPFTAYIGADAEWHLGNVFCKIVNCALNLTVYVTVYTLVLVCVVRYMAIVHHNWSARFRTRRNIIIAIMCIWILMLLISVPFGRIFGECVHDGVKQCRILREVYARNCFTFSCVFAYVAPLTVIGVLSSVTCVYINKKRDVIADHSTNSENRQRQAGRVIVCVVLAFALLWLPVHIDILWYYWIGYSPRKIHHIFDVFARCLAYFNSCVNPIIYNFTSLEFRRSFREAFHCRSSSRQRPTAFKSSTRSERTEITLDNVIPLLDQKQNK